MHVYRITIINGLVQMPFEGILIEAYTGTRRKHNKKVTQIGHTTSQYGQSVFFKIISAWNGHSFAENCHYPNLDLVFTETEIMYTKYLG